MTMLRALRRRILTPNASATRLEVRGFHRKDPSAQELLESIGRFFLAGYGHAAEARIPADAEVPLERLPVRFRGFAYEGAAMGFAIRDGLPVGGSNHVARFLTGLADAHVYMVHVGVGWAMARLPRFRWSGLHAPDPVLRWLVLDGYGFHQAYFRTRTYVQDQYREERFPWPADGPQWYADRVIDQGIGRALWFVGGADPVVVGELLDRFPEPRRPDLYSGAGLAATYAGGVDESELRAFWDHAGDYRSWVAQGATFAAAARVRADLVVPHNDVATAVFCGMSTMDASKLSEKLRPQPSEYDGQGLAGELPAYELWRQRIADEFIACGRC